MQTSRLFYKLMLWALAAAAACGILAMLTASYDTMGRVAATAFATAIAAGTAWGLAESLESASQRAARVAGSATIVVSYLFALLGIWEVSVTESWITSLTTGLSGLLVATLLCLRLIDGLRTAAQTGIVVVVASWAIAMIGLWGEVQECIASSVAVGVPGMVAAICLVRISFAPANLWKWFGVLAATAGSVGILLEIWHVVDVDKNIMAVLITISIAIAHIGLVVLVRLNPGQMWLRVAVIVAAIVTATCVCILIVSESRGNSFTGRLAGAAAIATGCGTLALAILRRFNRSQAGSNNEAAIKRLKFFCPKCGLKQESAFGAVECLRCHFRLQIDPIVSASESGTSSEIP